MYAVLDLFCGCGGMSWGLHKRGFNILAGIDIWDIALETYKKNHVNSVTFNLDISEVSPSVIMKEINLKKGELDIIIGGPPCQGFSKNTPASWRFLEDPKNQLFRSYIRFVEEFFPKIVVLENVAEIYNAYGGIVREEIKVLLEGLGYNVKVSVIDMSEYGIPQKRRRCFFLASRCGNLTFPKKISEKTSAWDAISDLPIVEQGEGYDGMPYTVPPQNKYQENLRINSSAVNNHIARKMRPIQAKRLSSLKPGQGLKDLPPDLKVKSGYSGAYGRLDFEMLAPTITRWVFHIGSGRFAHPREIRGLTMREAARLQSFSDDFFFCGSINDQAGQIGNAVPPLFISQLAVNIKSALEGEYSCYLQLPLQKVELV